MSDLTVASTTDSRKAIDAVAEGKIVREEASGVHYVEDPGSERQRALERLAEEEREERRIDEDVMVVTNKRSLPDPEEGKPEPEAAQAEAEGEPEQQSEPEPAAEPIWTPSVAFHQAMGVLKNQDPTLQQKINESTLHIYDGVAAELGKSAEGAWLYAEMLRNPVIVEDLMKVSPEQALRDTQDFIGHLRVSGTQATVKAATAPAQRKRSNAPPIVQTVRGSARPMSKSVYDRDIPYKEFRALREQQIKNRYKGRG